MKVLFDSIYTLYQSDDLSNGLSDLYNTQAPPDAVFPYGVFTLVSDVQEYTFAEEGENCLVQFSLFDDESSSVRVCDLFELLKTMLDFVDLTITGYTIISTTREVANLIKVEDVWQYVTTYRIVFEKD